MAPKKRPAAASKVAPKARKQKEDKGDKEDLPTENDGDLDGEVLDETDVAAVLVPGKLALEDKDKDKNEPANPPGDAFEACKSELSKSDSLNMKLAHLRDQSSLTPQQKLDLLNQSLTLKDWIALNGRFNTAKGKSDELKKAVSENPGNKSHRALPWLWTPPCQMCGRL